MLNLIRFHEQMQPVPGHPEFSGSAEEANAYYEEVVVPLLGARGIYPVFASAPRTLWNFHSAAAAARELNGDDRERWHALLARTGGEQVMALELARPMLRENNVLVSV